MLRSDMYLRYIVEVLKTTHNFLHNSNPQNHSENNLVSQYHCTTTTIDQTTVQRR